MTAGGGDPRFLRVAITVLVLALAVLALAILCGAFGCARDEGHDGVPASDAGATGTIAVTPGGVPYSISWWAEPFRPAVEAEIDAAARGELAFLVIVRPGIFETPASPTGRAAGLTDPANGMVIVAWRSSSEGPYLPAIEHEFNHVRCWRTTGDVDPLHVGCMAGK